MQKFFFSVGAVFLAGVILANSRSISPPPLQDVPIFTTQEGLIRFRSDAPLELISAESQNLRGALDASNQTFAFYVPIRSFDGFNNPLQKEHFNENYLESNHFPRAQFSGKVIEPIDFEAYGKKIIRAKGMMEIHGIKRERIIPVEMDIQANEVAFRSNFFIPLEVYNISVPKIVRQKIASEIEVVVEAKMVPRALNE